MSDETATDNVVPVSAFVVVKRSDSTFYAITDLDAIPEVPLKANTSDIKHGCVDILDTIRHIEASNILVGTMLGGATAAQAPEEAPVQP